MNPVDWKTALDGVSTTTIVLPIVVLTLPGVAAALGLKKISPPRPPKRTRKTQPGAATPIPGKPQTVAMGGKPAGNGKKSKLRVVPAGSLQRLWARLVAFLTIVAWAGAGLGMVPLGLVVFKAVEHTSKWTPLAIAAGLVLLLLATGLKMVKDLKDGVVDKPGLWAVAAPIVAVLVLAGPGLWTQTKTQANQTAQMMLGKVKLGDQAKHPQHHSGGGSHKTHHSGSGKKP